MELAMEEVEDMDTLKEATEKEEEVDIKEEERGGHVKAAEVVSRREPDNNSFDLGENVLDLNEETMELAMEETGTLEEATENTMLREELVETTGEEEERKGLVQQAEVDSKLQRSKLDDDNVFDLGENVLDMNEDTMELAMEEDEVEEMDIKESPVQAEVNSRVHSFLAIC